MTGRADREVKDCVEYFEQVHAPQSMNELVCARSIMRALSLERVQSEQAPSIPEAHPLTMVTDLLRTAHLSIHSSTQILAQYPGEPSVIANGAVQGTAAALHSEYSRLRRAMDLA